MTIREELEQYKPFNEQEERDRENLLRWIDSRMDLYTRSNTFAHFSASAWVTNSDRTKVLMAYHNIYHSWSWLGGHADGDRDLRHVALKEVKEESSVSHAHLLSNDIFSIEILTVDGHVKKGQYVSSHLHLNVTFLMEADEMSHIECRPDENSDVAWFLLDDAVNASSEPWFREHIYSKLNEKLRTGDF